LNMEITKCREDYFENKCSPHERVRALDAFCTEKDKCMNRDPETTNKNTKIMAKLLAEIINDFIEPLSYKTIIMLAVMLVLVIYAVEYLFGRTKIQHSQQAIKAA
jgi:hypothetical protein